MFTKNLIETRRNATNSMLIEREEGVPKNSLTIVVEPRRVIMSLVADFDAIGDFFLRI